MRVPRDPGIGETVAIRIYEPLEEPVPARKQTAANDVKAPNIHFGGIAAPEEPRA
jgi:hypothetical protein